MIFQVTSSSSEALLRRFLLALLTLGVAGVSTELVLLDHYEDGWQLAPFAVLGLGLISIAWHAAAGSAASLRLLRATMVLFLATGGAGIVLHYLGNLEFQREINPAQSQWEFFKKVIHAKAPPALAPAAMAQLGLLGLAYAFRHPALGTPSKM
jgi:hypothetical protein